MNPLSSLQSPQTLYSDTAPSNDTNVPINQESLEIYFVDVGQGDGIILKMPNGKFIVVDCNSGHGDEMAKLLHELNCKEIEAIVLSHPHADHIGGLGYLLKNFPVKSVFDPGYPHTTKMYKRLLLEIEKSNADYFMPTTGDTIAWDTRVQVLVLNASSDKSRHTNNSSIVLLLRYSEWGVILTGDAEKEVEHDIVNNFSGLIDIDILKVGHHGSRSSSTIEFLDETQPEFAVISVGKENSYRHPREETMRNLKKVEARVFRTDEQGTIYAAFFPDTMIIEPLKHSSTRKRLR